jgi:dienelactone hydrolase
MRENPSRPAGMACKLGVVLLFLLALLGAAGAGPALAQTATASALPAEAEYELIGEYDLARLDKILAADLQDFLSSSPVRDEYKKNDVFPAAQYPVKLYKVRYASVVPELGNSPTIASGLVVVPESGAKTMPVVSYQHGTVFSKDDVPSRPEQSSETRIMISRFAAQGYVVICADYFGRGDSDLPDSYLVKESTQQATYDMLQAAKSVLGRLGVAPGQLFISGWSQGGWATMAFLQKLESLKVPVAAAAVASGPVDVALTLNRWVNNPQPVDAVYLPASVTLLAHAYANYHGVPRFTEFAIRPQYVQAAHDLYAGRIDFTAFYAKTTPSLTDFTTPEFRAMVASASGAFGASLQAAQVYRWRQVTPLRTWYGGADEVTPEWIGRLPAQVQKLVGGADTQAFDAGSNADHRGVFLRAVRDQKPWFDSLLTK